VIRCSGEGGVFSVPDVNYVRVLVFQLLDELGQGNTIDYQGERVALLDTFSGKDDFRVAWEISTIRI